MTSSLPTLPVGLISQRDALHRLATYVIAPMRHRATGKFGLRSTPGGFGTPVFDQTQIRVDGAQVVLTQGDKETTAPITSLSEIASFLDAEIDPTTAAESDSPLVGDTEADLGVADEVVAFLATWWDLGTQALELVRADAASVDPSDVQLWPGHFDTAIEVGDDDRRGSYGASPGDANNDEPYLYVSVWWPDRLSIATDNPFWNASGYTGALLPFADLALSDNPVATAAAFFRQGRDELLAS